MGFDRAGYERQVAQAQLQLAAMAAQHRDLNRMIEQSRAMLRAGREAIAEADDLRWGKDFE